MKVLAVGDIHEKFWVLDRVKSIIDDYDHVVFVGDYADDFGATPVDRLEIWRAVRDLQWDYPDKVTVLMGNHDYVYVHKEYAGMYTGWDPIAQHLINADIETNLWLRELPLIHEIDGITYSHAGITDSWDGNLPLVEDGPLWVRPQWGYVYKTGQVFGHTPSETCWEVQKDVWCIDTFSTYADGTPFGDGTVLEITDGATFEKRSL